MLAKKYRLPVASVISKKGTVLRSPYFLVNVLPTTLTYSRVGVVVSSKVAALATRRNQLKRRFYDVFMQALPQLPAKDYLVIVRPGAYEGATLDAIIKELRSLTQ